MGPGCGDALGAHAGAFHDRAATLEAVVAILPFMEALLVFLNAMPTIIEAVPTFPTSVVVTKEMLICTQENSHIFGGDAMCWRQCSLTLTVSAMLTKTCIGANTGPPPSPEPHAQRAHYELHHAGTPRNQIQKNERIFSTLGARNAVSCILFRDALFKSSRLAPWKFRVLVSVAATCTPAV